MVRGHASFTSAEEARMTRLESWSGRGAAERSGRVDMARGPREVFFGHRPAQSTVLGSRPTSRRTRIALTDPRSTTAAPARSLPATGRTAYYERTRAHNNGHVAPNRRMCIKKANSVRFLAPASNGQLDADCQTNSCAALSWRRPPHHGWVAHGVKPAKLCAALERIAE